MELIQAQRVPLFDDEPDTAVEESLADIRNTMDVTRKVQAIRALERDIEQLEMQNRESIAFYQHRKEICQERAESLKRQILSYLQATNRRNIATPAGTAYQRVVTSKLWPPDEDLLSWCTRNVPEAVRVRSEVDKRIVAEHVKTTGNIPDGYAESQQVKLYIK